MTHPEYFKIILIIDNKKSTNDNLLFKNIQYVFEMYNRLNKFVFEVGGAYE